ncbi:MAG TPA: aldo/keto reductase [Verrucomicrobiae bacterium]|jgi:aryl-alcohol dehydrogenase-like predicted oxidoreductase
METNQSVTARNWPRNLARRDFFKAAGILGAEVALAANGQSNPPSNSDASQGQGTSPAGIPLRKLGRADAQISALGCGGHHLGDLKNIDDAIQLVREAVDGGITFFDNCWEYWNGKSENILGRGIKGRRDKVFLMTKVCTHGRSGRLAMEMLEQSLRRLQTDHLDLWQIHGVVYDNDPELAYAKGGVIEALDNAKRSGKTRFVGFTGHKDPAIHLKMIKMGFPFDTVQMPLNPFDANFFSFEKEVLPEVNRRGMAALGMKSMCGTADPVKKGIIKPEELLRYAMSLPVATTISGMDSLEVLHKNLELARNFKPMSESEMEDLRQRCAPPAADGRFEPYKMSLKFDNQWTRLPHGFPVDKQEKEVKDMLEKANGAWEPVGM